jgi:hypothetical protein
MRYYIWKPVAENAIYSSCHTYAQVILYVKSSTGVSSN